MNAIINQNLHARPDAAIRQNELFEASLYHQNTGTYGFFSILASDRNAAKVQHSYPLPQLPVVLTLLPKDRDSYLSQAEFIKPNRRVINLARVGLLFIDIDCYKCGYTPQQASAALLNQCDETGIPHPSIIIYSGRGIYAKWLLETALPRQALPRWNRAQIELVRAFESIGADSAARDASRVLRVVGTVNTKNGEVVQIAHITPGADAQPVRYSFDYLCEWLLPFSREQLEKMRSDRAEQREQRQQKAALHLASSQQAKTGLRAFSGRQLAWHRLEDLRTLASLRGGVVDGGRMVWTFWALNFLLLSGATNSNQMYYEVRALAAEIGFRDMQDGELSTLFRKAQAHERGETVDFNGHRYSPLYTPKNATLIDAFQITDIEQKQLRTIVSQDEAKERHRARDETRRRASGAKAHSSEEIRASARLMRAGGMTQTAIANELGVSQKSVSNWLIN